MTVHLGGLLVLKESDVVKSMPNPKQQLTRSMQKYFEQCSPFLLAGSIVYAKNTKHDRRGVPLYRMLTLRNTLSAAGVRLNLHYLQLRASCACAGTVE